LNAKLNTVIEPCGSVAAKATNAKSAIWFAERPIVLGNETLTTSQISKNAGKIETFNVKPFRELTKKCTKKCKKAPSTTPQARPIAPNVG